MNGKLCWISSDILEEIKDDLDAGDSVSEILRQRLGLPSREPLNKKKPDKKRAPRWKYPAYDLTLGESMLVRHGDYLSFNSVYQSVQRQAAKYSMVFDLKWHLDGIQVTRIG